MLAVVDVNGKPVFFRLAVGRFDSTGQWSFGGTVPPGLSGALIQFLSLGLYPPGVLGLSNRATVRFQ